MLFFIVFHNINSKYKLRMLVYVRNCERHKMIYEILFLSPSWHLGPKISSCFAKNAGKLAGRPSKARRAHPKQRNWWAQSCLCWWENKLTFARQSGCESMLAQPPQSEKMMLAMSKIPLFYLHLISNLKNNDKQVQMLPCQPNYGLFLVVNSNFI